MKYTNGEIVRLGDLVKLEPNLTGTVVCSVDTAEYNREYPKEQWMSYLTKGILVKTNEIGLVHLEENDVNLVRM